MKQLGYTLLIVLFTLFVCGCNDKKPKQLRVEKATVDKDLLHIYDKDIRQYFIDFDEVGLDGVCAMGVKKQVKYTDIAVELIYEALRREGFTSVSNEDARKAILKYYNIDISKSNKFLVKYDIRRYVFKDGDAAERKEQIWSMDQDPGYLSPSFWFKWIYVPNYNYLFPHPTISDVIDIKGMGYDEDFNIEKAKKGKIYYNLLNKAYYYENMFIFHDDKEAFKWLTKNDKSFLLKLLGNYGYDKNDVINKIAIDSINTKEEHLYKAYGDVFASHNAAGKLQIHRNLLKFMVNHAGKNSDYFYKIRSYLNRIFDLEGTPRFTNFTKEERYEIGAVVGYYYGLMYNSQSPREFNEEALEYQVHENAEFVSFVKQHHYFGIKDLPRVMKEAYDRYEDHLEIFLHHEGEEGY